MFLLSCYGVRLGFPRINGRLSLGDETGLPMKILEGKVEFYRGPEDAGKKSPGKKNRRIHRDFPTLERAGGVQ
jgi:hypothetical protein